MGDLEFQEFFEILRSGDQESVEKAIALLEPWLHRVIRLRLFDSRVRRVTDTTDIAQSLIKDFLSQGGGEGSAAENRWSVKHYLVAAVRNKIITRLRKERRHLGNLDAHPEPSGAEAAPAQQVEERDLVNAVRSRLREESRPLFDLRMQGFTWPEVSKMVEGQSDALRMRLRRSAAAAICQLSREEIARGG